MGTDITKFELVIIIITLHGFLLSALMAIGQIISDHRSIKNWLFFGLFLDLSFFQIHYVLFAIGTIGEYYFLSFLPISAFFLLGPIMFLLTQYSVDANYGFNYRSLVHFIPIIFFTVLSMFFLHHSPQKTALWFSGYFYNEYNQIIGCVGSGSLLIYILLSVKIIYSNHLIHGNIFKADPRQIIIMLLLIGLSLAWLSDIIAGFTGIKLFMTLSILLISMMIVVLFLINSKYPDFQKQLHQIVEKEKRKRSYLANTNIPDLEVRLHQLITEDEIFLDEDLTLTELAQKLNITTHQLSEFLNEQIGKNFTTFINKHRVEKAKKLLLRNKDLSILSIAFDSGFKAKSTFNSTFVKMTGISPREYRQKHDHAHKNKKNSPDL